MPYCSVKWCGKCSATSSLTKDGITFHRFPKCYEMKQKWIIATKREDNWIPGKNHVICSRHFTEDCFRPIRGNRRFLFETAVPTLMLPCLQSAQDTVEASTSSKPAIKEIIILTPATQPTTSIDTTINISLTKNVQNILTVPSTSAKSKLENQGILTPITQQNTGVDSLLNFPSTYSTPRERRLHRAVIDLSQKIKKKNVALKRLRDSNRVLKRKVHSLKQRLDELEKKQLVSQENSSILAAVGLQDDHSSDSTDSDREDSHKEPLPDPRCSLCSKEITGFVFVCVQCDVRLCGACDARGHHATHYVLRVPIGRPEKELRAVVDHVREAIESAGLALNKEAENSEGQQEDTNEEETVFKTEIKEEVDVDEEDPLGSPEYDECPPAAPSASGSQVVPEPEELKPEPSGTSRQSGSPASPASSRRQSTASDSDDLQPLAKKRRTSRSVTIPIHTTKDAKAIDKRISTSDPIADAGSPTGVVTRIRLKKE